MSEGRPADVAGTDPAAALPAAPRLVRVQRTVSVDAYTDVCCGRCAAALEPVFDDTVGDDGAWRSLQAVDALQLHAIGGYGMYVDPGLTRKSAPVLLCRSCTDWLRGQVPGLHQVLIELERS